MDIDETLLSLEASRPLRSDANKQGIDVLSRSKERSIALLLIKQVFDDKFSQLQTKLEKLKRDCEMPDTDYPALLSVN
jgi:hypothetical protein